MDKPVNIQENNSTPERARVRLFDDLLERAGLTRPWIAIALGSVLYLLYLFSNYIDGFQRAFSDFSFWRKSLEPVAILVYVLLIHTFLDYYARRAVQSVRPVVALDDTAFNERVAHMSASILRYQWIAMLIFAVISVPLVNLWDWSEGFLWTKLVSGIISLLEYAFIGSVMYLIVARNWFFTNLFKQPLKIDIFNPAPVWPMGRWGLGVSAAIMGGVTISVLLVGDPQSLLTLEHLPAYLAAMATAILSFFASLSSTHRVLVRAKQKELSAIRTNLSTMYTELKKRSEFGRFQGMDEGRSTEMANTIAAWLGYERRIEAAPEWPFTANTLSGLFATILLPLIVTAIQKLLFQ